MIMASRLCPWAVASALLALPGSAGAVDTVESFDVGATDVDFYAGYDGVGLERDERSLSGELMLGYGIIEGLSAYLGTALAADDALSNGLAEVYLGLYGTPLDTDHVDLDLFLDFRLGGEALTEFQVGPALELNFDLVPDLGLWGVYLVVSTPTYRQAFLDGAGEQADRVGVHVETTLGTYLTIGERHQILLDYTMAFRPRPADDERPVEVGSVGLGYNVVVHDAVELITEARLDIPQQGEPVAVGFVAGFIATLPSPRLAPSGQLASTDGAPSAADGDAAPAERPRGQQPGAVPVDAGRSTQVAAASTPSRGLSGQAAPELEGGR